MVLPNVLDLKLMEYLALIVSCLQVGPSTSWLGFYSNTHQVCVIQRLNLNLISIKLQKEVKCVKCEGV